MGFLFVCLKKEFCQADLRCNCVYDPQSSHALWMDFLAQQLVLVGTVKGGSGLACATPILVYMMLLESVSQSTHDPPALLLGTINSVQFSQPDFFPLLLSLNTSAKGRRRGEKPK